jgi:hypothetical protein
MISESFFQYFFDASLHASNYSLYYMFLEIMMCRKWKNAN